ncbi:MAG: YbhB/YbcL family Raf kinase inhibitor-like protein, partial [Patescibacteria group bacterium]
MKKSLFFIVVILILIIGGFWFWRKQKNNFPNVIPMANLTLKSSAFENNSSIPQKYTCDGENISPPLTISGEPQEAKDLVLILEDPDAPQGTFTHWTIWNIPLGIKEIEEGMAPEGAIEGQTDFGEIGYGGPCPPSGTHRY